MVGKVVVVVQALCLIMASSALAGQFTLGTCLGYNAPTGEAGKQVDDGVAYGMYAAYAINSTVSVELNAVYSSHDDVVDERGAYTIDMWSFLIGPKVGFPYRGMLLALTLGLGFYPLDLHFEPEGTGKTPRRDDDTESGVYIGGAIDVPLGSAVVLGFDVRYHALFNTDIMDGDMLSTQVRIGYQF